MWSSGLSSSCCLGPGAVDAGVAEAADKCAPRSIFPCSLRASAEDVRQQIAACQELDDMTWTLTGREERVNATMFAQPRRKSWSVVIDEVLDHPDGRRRYELFSYSQSYRPPADWRAAPIPRAVFELGVCCWQAAWPYLSPISQACPPTGCQLMVYSTLFASCIGRHRDNGLEPPDGQHGRLGNSVDENSQIRGSSVLVYSAGPAMTFALSAPPEGRMPWEAKKTEYEIQLLCTIKKTGFLGPGTIS